MLLGAGSRADSRRSAPKLSSDLQYRAIFKGEEIPLKCSPPEECQAESFVFYCKDQSDLTITNENLDKNTLILRTADLNSKLIKCTCRFIERVGGWATSRQSNQLVFTFVDSWIPAPTLSSSLSHTVINKGEKIALKCFLPEKYWADSFIFYCKDQSDLTVMYEQLNNNIFNFRTADLDSVQTEIKCICWFRESAGGFVLSLKSNQLVFSVKGSLPSPVLRVDPLSQRVKEGDPLIFHCSTEGENAEKKFHFYRDGVEITSSYEGLRKDSSDLSDPLQNGSLRIPRATFKHSGEFACNYEENINGRWVMTSWSQGVKVTVDTQNSNPIWRYSWMVIPVIMLIILLVSLAFYCCKRKSISPSHEPFQLVEKKGDVLGMMEPQATAAATSSSVKDSEVTYSSIQDTFTLSPPGPTRKNLLPRQEEERILYSDIVSQPKRRQQSHP